MHQLRYFLKSMLALNMLFIFWGTEIFSQIPVKGSHAIADPAFSPLQSIQATGTLDVVAVMVEFQPDSNRLTSGNGTFGPGSLPFLENNSVVIDPLPHDRSYFEAHLEFAKNYFEKSSDGQLTINYRVLPEIYRLPKKMEEYSPTGITFTNEKLAELSRDTWNLVNEDGGFDFSGLDPERTAFIIFHAGVGRDIELTGTTLDITPYDIPSIYLSKNNIAELLNNPGFDGFEMNNGAFRVTNSLIIPRTESRRGEDIQEDEIVLELSINGILVASIASHLGLPDLFNTETGEPAIGRFGLMDGAGFFSYNGLFPPEPSAWEKVYLGWETPLQISVDDDEITLPAASLNQPNSIAKVELSTSEYFLLENRHRDVSGNGIILTIRKPDGTEVEQPFSNHDTDFIDLNTAELDTLLESGVLVDVNNFDFSLPGGLDIGVDEREGTDDDRELNGGILIWHIDEGRITAGLQSGGVNTDRFNRGVDLEEADGAQDIGPGIPGALDNSAAFGTPFDFWWSGNDYRVINESGGSTSFYQNRFAPDTRPDNNSNSGAPSFFELYDFSDILPVASFKIRKAQPQQDIYTHQFSVQLDSSISYSTPTDLYYDYYPLSLSIFETTADTFLIIPTAEGTKAVQVSDPQYNQFDLTATGVQQPFIGDDVLILAEKPDASESLINVSALVWNASLQQFDTLWTSTLPRNKGFISSQSGDTIHADFTTDGLLTADGSSVQLYSAIFQESEVIDGNKSRAFECCVEFKPQALSGDFLPDNTDQRYYTGIIQLGSKPLFYIFEDEKFTIVDPESETPVTLIEETAAEWPAIIDDANILWVDKQSNQISGKNKLGGYLEHLPISAPDDVQFTGTPLIMSFTGKSEDFIFLVAGIHHSSLNIYAYDFRGEMMDGFPLYAGKAPDSHARIIHPIIYNSILYAVGDAGLVQAWNLKNVTGVKWAARYGNAPYNKVSARVNDSRSGSAPGFRILNSSETYNWPNPANDVTNIRFEIAPPGGEVEISVISMSGRIIYQNTISATGGAPQDVEINTSQWGSGGYVGTVKATVNGKSETKIIKIGVVH